MTFPHDALREDIHAEDHSLASIAGVSAIMIAASLFSLTMLL